MNENYTIGQLAKAASVNVETIRYYERRGVDRTTTQTNRGLPHLFQGNPSPDLIHQTRPGIEVYPGGDCQSA